MAPRVYYIVIIGKGLRRKLSLTDQPEIEDLLSSLKLEFNLSADDINRLEIRQVNEKPSPANAEANFDASPTVIDDDAPLRAAGVEYLVGRINEPAQPGAYSHEVAANFAF